MSQAFITKRYAASYSITMGSLSLTVPDNGLSEILSFNVGPFVAGTYTLSIMPVSDTGINGTAVTKSITIGGAPVAPGVPIYVSGDITDTMISFSASTTAGATYNIYLPQEVGSPTFIESPATTHAAGSGTISVTLPALAAAAGDVTVFVTSVSGGIESGYQKVTISYNADGTVVSDAPNVPTLTFQNIPVSSGRNINVTYAYDSVGQNAAPSKIQTQIIKYESSVTTTQTAVTIGTLIGNRITGNLVIPSGSDGWFQAQARTVSAGSVNSEWSPLVGPIWCSNETIGGVTGLITNIVG